MKVLVSDRQKDLPLKHEKHKIEQIVQLVLQAENRLCDEVAFHFVTSQVICKLHKQFFNDPQITDCISFPMDQGIQAGFCYLGDVFICPKQALCYAEEHAVDPYREITIYIVHGLLHLLGYDDIEPHKRKIMRAKEQKYLRFVVKLGLVLCPL